MEVCHLTTISLQTHRGTQERDPGHQEDKIFCGTAEIPTGEEAVRCQGCYRAVQSGASQHDGEDKGERQVGLLVLVNL